MPNLWELMPHTECAPAPRDTLRSSLPLMNFTMDIGCGHDLISKSRAKKLELEMNPNGDSMSFLITNRVTSTTATAEIDFKELGAKSNLFVTLGLSVGKKCLLDQGVYTGARSL